MLHSGMNKKGFSEDYKTCKELKILTGINSSTSEHKSAITFVIFLYKKFWK